MKDDFVGTTSSNLPTKLVQNTHIGVIMLIFILRCRLLYAHITIIKGANKQQKFGEGEPLQVLGVTAFFNERVIN